MLGDLIGAVGGLIGVNKQTNTQKDINSENIAQSREFAQSGIQWRVEDARKAGIHPLAAMGMPLASGPNLSVSSPDYGSTFADMGQNIGRAVGATLNREERQKAAISDALTLERKGLENELLRTQISSIKSPSNPPFPSLNGSSLPSQTDSSGLVTDKPLERIVSAPSSSFSEPASITDAGWVKTSSGGVALVPSLDVKQRIEDQFVPETMWAVRNQLLPAVQGIMHGQPSSARPPREFMRYGDNAWRFDSKSQEWRSYYDPKLGAMMKRLQKQR